MTTYGSDDLPRRAVARRSARAPIGPTTRLEDVHAEIEGATFFALIVALMIRGSVAGAIPH